MRQHHHDCEQVHSSEWHLYYNCTKDLGILSSRQKKYEILENMKNPSYNWRNKYENLEEPSRASHARFSYFFNPLVKSYQIFILIHCPSYNWPVFHTFEPHCQNLPDLHTFSVSLSKFARLSYVFNLLKIWQTSIGKLSKIEEISESYFKMSNPLGAGGP